MPLICGVSNYGWLRIWEFLESRHRRDVKLTGNETQYLGFCEVVEPNTKGSGTTNPKLWGP